MFTAAGTFTCNIDDVKFAEPKFAKGANDFDICIHVVDSANPTQADWWRGEVSEAYGKGNFASMMQKDITMQTLRKIGFDGDDLSTLREQLVGKQCPATVAATDKDGQIYYNIKYLGASGAVIKELDPNAMKSKIAAMFGGSGGAMGTAPAPAASAPAQTAPKSAPAMPKPNPFAAKPASGSATAKPPF